MNDLTRQLGIHLMRVIMSRDYSKLALFMLMMARSTKNDDLVERIEEIKDSCPIEFEIFCILYMKSFAMPPNRGIRFGGTGRKLYWTQVRSLAEEHIVTPLNEVAIELSSRMGYADTRTLKGMFEGKVGLETHKLDDPEVIL